MTKGSRSVFLSPYSLIEAGAPHSSAATQRSANGSSRNGPDAAVTAPASYQNAFAPDMLKEGPFLWPVDVPEAENYPRKRPFDAPPPWPHHGSKTIGLSVIGRHTTRMRQQLSVARGGPAATSGLMVSCQRRRLTDHAGVI